MKRFAIVVLAAGSLTACTASRTSSIPAMPQPASQRPASGAQPQTSPSWIDPAAKSGDLLYVTNANGTVTVYSYPQGKLVGTLTGFEKPFGACSDKKGNVYITDYSSTKITEYAHGATKPLRTLKDTNYRPQGCAINPVTGALAVANYDQSYTNYPGNLSVYRKARGVPRPYTVQDFYYYWFAAYDGTGNAYVNGQFSVYGENYELAILAKKRQLTEIILPVTLGFPGGIAWDGQYVALGDQSSDKIYQFAIAKGQATLANTITLDGVVYGGQFAIDGSTLVMPNQTNSGSNVLFYNYPAGGSPTLTITDGVGYPYAVAISHVGSR
jgi:FlaG/FlaF family flagellin (archaellin)